MASTQADYREWLRLRLGCKTPKEAWTQGRDLGWDVGDECPPVGAQPVDQIEPSNYKLNSAIRSAAYKVTRECRVMNAWRFIDVDVPAVTTQGPYTIQLSRLPGFAENEVTSVKRCYWNTDGGAGETFIPLNPVLLQQLDVQVNNYLNNGPATPYQYAIEPPLLYLLPGAAQSGSIRLTVGSGVLAPLADTEGYGIPTAYDDAINYQALLELAEIMPNDTEMTKRARSFTDNAEQGIVSLAAYFDNVMLDEYTGVSRFATNVTRYLRRN